MNGSEAEGVLKGARGRKTPWPEVVQALNAIEGTVPESGRPWIRVCAEWSGYSAGQLRRFQALERFVDRAVSAHRPREKILTVAFTTLETIARICSADPKLGYEYLDRVLSGHVPRIILEEELRSVSNSHKNKLSPGAAGRRAAAEFRKKCLDVIENRIGNLDISNAIIPKSGLLYPNPDYLIVHSKINSQPAVIGVDVFDVRGVEYGDIIKKYALPEVTKATFLDELWIVCAGYEAHNIAGVIDKLGRNNIGQVIIGDGMSKFEVINPLGRPVPDRRRLWISDMSSWLRKAITRKGWRLPEG